MLQKPLIIRAFFRLIPIHSYEYVRFDMGLNGHELSSKSLDKPPVSDNASAKCGAVGAKTGAIDAIANAIKSLSDTERQQLINLMQQKGQTP